MQGEPAEVRGPGGGLVRCHKQQPSKPHHVVILLSYLLPPQYLILFRSGRSKELRGVCVFLSLGNCFLKPRPLISFIYPVIFAFRFS